MIKFKQGNLNKKYPNIKEDFHNIKFEKDRNLLNIDNKQNIDNLFRKNFPELKLTNIKTRPGTESPDFNRGKKIKTISTVIQNNEKISSIIPRNRQNNLLMKKKEFNFPKVNSVNNKDNKEVNELFKNTNSNFSICNNFSTRWNLKIGINNNNINRDNKTYFNKKSPIKNEEIKIKDNATFFKKLMEKKEDEDKIKEGNNSYQKNSIIPNNFTLNAQNIKAKIRQMHKNNIQLQKLKIIKKNASNNILSKNAITPNSTTKTNPFQGISSFYNHFNNKVTINNQKLTNKPVISPISNDRNKPNTERINPMNNIFNILKNFSSSEIDGIIPIQKNINITSEIYRAKYKNFEKSKKSTKEDIKKEDYIKGYGYNSCLGNIRDNNEDEIIITKIYFNNDPNNYCFYFGIFDGHGGNGCSTFLKNNLHKNIKEFSAIGLKIGIDITEEKFKTNEAMDENGEIKDSSGSCGLILMIKEKKCIIANIGNSRLVVFKNNKIDFETMDHKPDSIIEKARIELAGGKIYKPPNLYQEENKIEMPWRVLPGELCVSRALGDIQAKDENFGGNKTVVICMPDITEINLDDNYNFIVMGSDGIFDVLKNEELLECINIVLKEKKIEENINDEDVHKLCGNFADMIIKSSLAKNSFDNLSCIVIGLNLENLLY